MCSLRCLAIIASLVRSLRYIAPWLAGWKLEMRKERGGGCACLTQFLISSAPPLIPLSLCCSIDLLHLCIAFQSISQCTTSHLCRSLLILCVQFADAHSRKSKRAREREYCANEIEMQREKRREEEKNVFFSCTEAHSAFYIGVDQGRRHREMKVDLFSLELSLSLAHNNYIKREVLLRKGKKLRKKKIILRL